MAETDRLYVLNSLVKSYGESPFAQSLPKSVYRAGHSRLAEHLIARSRVLIACDPSDTGTILGWCATEGDILHFCYVRSAVRRRGIAKKLLAPYLKTRAIYSHSAPWLRLPDQWVRDPYAQFDWYRQL
jgi:GNAT superfamily N-acetyltransferase